jgi:hypothetical protein
MAATNTKTAPATSDPVGATEAVTATATPAPASAPADASAPRGVGGVRYTPLQKLQAGIERIEREIDTAAELLGDVPAESVPGLNDILLSLEKAVGDAYTIARKAVRAERKARV